MHESSEDKNKLKQALDSMGEGRFEFVDPATFDDPSIAECFNECLDKVVKRNNHYLARINDAQIRIGDTSCLKSMFEQISSQQDGLKYLQQSTNSMDNGGAESLHNKNLEFLALSEQICSSYDYFLSESEEIVKEVDGLITSPEVEAMPDNSLVKSTLKHIHSKLNNNYDRIDSMSRRVTTMTEDTRMVFKVIDARAEMNDLLMKSVRVLTESYKNLSNECLETGRYLYRISRDIDNCRNDMFRHNSKLTLHDRLKIYEVDHITLAWRLYNNIVEFESLRLTQLNNPTTCKFGVWVEEMKDPLFLECEAYKKAVDLHIRFHAVSVECFEAKLAYDTKLAMEKFNVVIDILDQFKTSFEEMHEYLSSKGITEETEVWKYRR